MVRALAEAGSTILLSTQYLEEADNLADDIVVIDSGAVSATGTPAELKRRLGRQTLEVTVSEAESLAEAVRRVAHIVGTEPFVDRGSQQLHVPVSDGHIMPSVVRSLDEAGIIVSDMALRLPSLDDVFLTLTGHHVGEPKTNIVQKGAN